MALELLVEVPWTGDIPGYGDASRAITAISIPNIPVIQLPAGKRVALPEPANYVSVSDGGKWAWQGHTSGLIYEGLVSTGKKGYDRHSFLYVGETLHVLTDVATYQATAGGWRYVDEKGQLVAYGPTYSGNAAQGIPWERTVFADGLMIGQGPNDGDGAVVSFKPARPTDPRVFLQLCSGDAHDIRVRRDAADFLITVVFYAEHVTRVYSATLSDLAALPRLAAAPPPVQPPTPPEPPTMNFPNHLDIVKRERAKYGETLTDQQCFAVTNAVANDPAVAADGWGLTSPPSGSGVTIDGRIYRLDKLSHKAGYICDVLGDTPGKASAQWGPNADAAGTSQWAPAIPIAGTPSQPPVQPPPVQPPADPNDAALSARVGAVEATLAHVMSSLQALENKPAPQIPDLSQFARKGDKVAVRGSVSLASILSSVKLVWSGVIGTADDLPKE